MNRYGAVGAALLLLGVATFAGGVYFTVQQEQGLSNVARTDGTVLSASLEPADGEQFFPNVTYRYAVDGRNYTSNRIFPDERRRPASRSDALEVVRRYRAGQNVTVFYPSSAPGESSLRAPRSPVPIFAIGFGIVLVAFGILSTAAGRQVGEDPIETDEVTLGDREPTPRDRTADDPAGETDPTGREDPTDEENPAGGDGSGSDGGDGPAG